MTKLPHFPKIFGPGVIIDTLHFRAITKWLPGIFMALFFATSTDVLMNLNSAIDCNVKETFKSYMNGFCLHHLFT